MIFDANSEEIRRLLDPSTDRDTYSIPFDKLVIYDASKHISKMQRKVIGRPDLLVERHSLVVFIDGACRGNGTPSARASYGVYFGPDSPYNTYGLLAQDMPQTSTRAEIEALSQALSIICDITDNDFTLSHITIATDSAYLVESMSERIERWIEQGGLGYKGKEFAHFEVLKNLHEKLDWMEYSDDGGRTTKFWHIPRELNVEADALANKAFAT
ncbi:hypothetical protein J1614_009092 [Plenodomus biglobosus]|nr:hypothetical protein J1614_009092 [Plenodomus biglobosus]